LSGYFGYILTENAWTSWAKFADGGGDSGAGGRNPTHPGRNPRQNQPDETGADATREPHVPTERRAVS